MKVSEMVELLQQMPQDLEVYSYCDHGQTPEESCEPSVYVLTKANNGYTDPESYMTWADAIDSGYEKSDLVEIVLL